MDLPLQDHPGGSPWVEAEVPAGGGDASGVSPGCQPRCLLTAPRGPGAALGAREPSVRCPQEGRDSWGTGGGHLRTSSLHPRGPWLRWSCQAGQEGWTPPLSSTGKRPKGFLYGLDECPGVWSGAAFPLESGTCWIWSLGFPAKSHKFPHKSCQGFYPVLYNSLKIRAEGSSFLCFLLPPSLTSLCSADVSLPRPFLLLQRFLSSSHFLFFSLSVFLNCSLFHEIIPRFL